MLHIVDHYSKFLFGKLLENKKADTVLNSIKNILFISGMPNEIGTDNGAEFKNKKFISVCEENEINLIHGLPENHKIFVRMLECQNFVRIHKYKVLL